MGYRELLDEWDLQDFNNYQIQTILAQQELTRRSVEDQITQTTLSEEHMEDGYYRGCLSIKAMYDRSMRNMNK